MARKTTINLKLITGFNIAVLIITSLIIHAACEAGTVGEKMSTFKNDLGTFKDNLKTGIKNTAVTTVGYVSPSAAKTLDSTNITQTIYNAPNSIASGISDTAKATAVSAVGFVSPGAASTLKLTNIRQSMRETIYSAPTNISSYFRDKATWANAKFNNIGMSLGNSLGTGFNNLNIYLNSKFNSFKNSIGMNTPSKPGGLHYSLMKSELKITRTVSDVGSSNLNVSDMANITIPGTHH